MREVFGDLWEYPADIRVITTNGDVNRFGQAVMGRGVALQAKQRYPNIEKALAYCLSKYGLRVVMLRHDLFAFPVKRHWHEKARLSLIRRSAQELVSMTDRTQVVVLPRPGCGNGGLSWEDVKPVIAPILKSKRFVVIERLEEQGC